MNRDYEVRLASGRPYGPRRRLIRCADPECIFKGGYRTADTPEDAVKRPCPRCGGSVEVADG